MNIDKAKIKKHESFGMVQFNRISSNIPKKFFGSSVRSGNYIELNLYEAEKLQEGSSIRYFANKTIMKVRLSPNQFAELLTTMNIGSGVPCTIEYIEGKTIEECSDEDNIRELHKKDFKKQIEKATKEVQEAIDDVSKLVEVSKVSFGIKQRKELLQKLNHVLMRLKSNLPYYHQQFDEAVDKTVSEAKSELDSFANNMITKLGLESLDQLKAIQEIKPDLPALDTERDKENE